MAPTIKSKWNARATRSRWRWTGAACAWSHRVIRASSRWRRRSSRRSKTVPNHGAASAFACFPASRLCRLRPHASALLLDTTSAYSLSRTGSSRGTSSCNASGPRLARIYVWRSTIRRLVGAKMATGRKRVRSCCNIVRRKRLVVLAGRNLGKAERRGHGDGAPRRMDPAPLCRYADNHPCWIVDHPSLHHGRWPHARLHAAHLQRPTWSLPTPR